MMSDLKVHFSSSSDNWATPDLFFQKMVEDFGVFDLDVCADVSNRKAKKFYTKKEDGLIQDWYLDGRLVWMNPPYGRSIGMWIKKAFEESLKGCKVVCLIPSRTDTAWWHEYVVKGDIRFIRGRLKFGGCKNAAPFPSAVVVFG